MTDIAIQPFASRYQQDAESLIRSGLAERWGADNPALNQDLKNLAATFGSGGFYVMLQGTEVIATGGFVLETAGERDHKTARISRMSVAAPSRGKGLGRKMLQHIEQACRSHGVTRIVLETTSSWLDAVNFYTACGYTLEQTRDGDSHFYRLLEQPWLNGQIVLFDGTCALCHGAVRFVINHDSANQFRFLSQQSDLGTRVLRDHNIDPDTDSTMVLLSNGVPSVRSEAALAIAERLDRPYSWLRVLRLVPASLCDVVYRYVGRHRYRWFGRSDICDLQTQLDSERLLD